MSLGCVRITTFFLEVKPNVILQHEPNIILKKLNQKHYFTTGVSKPAIYL